MQNINCGAEQSEAMAYLFLAVCSRLNRPELLEATVASHAEALEAEMTVMETEATRLAEEIDQLTGVSGPE